MCIRKKKSNFRRKTFIKLKNGDCGKVLKIHVIKEFFDMLRDDGIIKRYRSTIFSNNKNKPPKDWKFPKEFKFVNNETSEVIEWEEGDENPPS